MRRCLSEFQSSFVFLALLQKWGECFFCISVLPYGGLDKFYAYFGVFATEKVERVQPVRVCFWEEGRSINLKYTRRYTLLSVLFYPVWGPGLYTYIYLIYFLYPGVFAFGMGCASQAAKQSAIIPRILMVPNCRTIRCTIRPKLPSIRSCRVRSIRSARKPIWWRLLGEAESNSAMNSYWIGRGAENLHHFRERGCRKSISTRTRWWTKMIVIWVFLRSRVACFV